MQTLRTLKGRGVEGSGETHTNTPSEAGDDLDSSIEVLLLRKDPGNWETNPPSDRSYLMAATSMGKGRLQRFTGSYHFFPESPTVRATCFKVY